MAGIHITDIEAAINFWREKRPSPDGVTLAPELRDLAELYAVLVFRHQEEADEREISRRRLCGLAASGTTPLPDTPCIAICSTSQGDDICKGCGRSFDEVQRWPGMTPGRKARGLAPHHVAGDGLALQSLCRTGRAPGRRLA